MLLSEHSLEDIERRYLECFGEAKINEVWRVVCINHVNYDVGAIKLTIYPERVVSIVDAQTCNWQFRFNIPPAQWCLTAFGEPIYVGKQMRRQFRRGINQHTVEFYRFVVTGRGPLPVNYSPDLVLSVIYQLPVSLAQIRARIIPQQPHLISNVFAVFDGTLYYNRQKIGEVNHTDKTITVVDTFDEELRDAIKRLGGYYTEFNISNRAERSLPKQVLPIKLNEVAINHHAGRFVELPPNIVRVDPNEINFIERLAHQHLIQQVPQPPEF